MAVDDLGQLRWVWQVFTSEAMPSASPYPELSTLSFETLADLLGIELKRDRPDLNGSVDIVLGGRCSEQQSGDELPLLNMGDGAQITLGVVLHQFTLMGAEMRRPWADALGEHFFVWLDAWLKADDAEHVGTARPGHGAASRCSLVRPVAKVGGGEPVAPQGAVGVLKGLLFAGLIGGYLIVYRNQSRITMSARLSDEAFTEGLEVLLNQFEQNTKQHCVYTWPATSQTM